MIAQKSASTFAASSLLAKVWLPTSKSRMDVYMQQHPYIPQVKLQP